MSFLPKDKRFAFTVVDDTDHATVESVGPVYRLLGQLGIRTTKTIWVEPPTQPSPYDGSATAADGPYRDFCAGLQREGFEIALHGVTMHSSERPAIERGLARFAEWFGGPPRIHVNHFDNADNLYWGQARVATLPCRAIYRVASRQPPSQGHVEGSSYFWGDLAQQQVDYVRNFTFRETDLTKIGAPVVYDDPLTPFARRRFISTEGGTLADFLAALSENRQDELADRGGICIMYTHFGSGFVEHGELNTNFERTMRRLAGLGGWFVPACELLDAICAAGCPTVSPGQRGRLERRWIAERLRHGAS